jgi:hypothetical protein
LSPICHIERFTEKHLVNLGTDGSYLNGLYISQEDDVSNDSNMGQRRIMTT